jgi:hypothetical protein
MAGVKRPVRAISIRQPFVELILRGSKRKEFRSRPTRVRGPVYIYASLKPNGHIPSWRKLGLLSEPLPMGVIVGTVEIVDCKPVTDGGYAWILKNPLRLRKHLKPKNQPQPSFWFPVFRNSRPKGSGNAG